MDTRTIGALAAALLLAAGCGGGAEEETAAARGEKIYKNVCVACHGNDPSQDGTVGPAVAGASRALLLAKVVNNSYPPGYEPKRPTRLMPPLPYLEDHVGDLAAYLQAASPD